MKNKQELVHFTFRKDNGQIGYMSKGIPIPEFYQLIQSKQQQDISINVLIDFYPIIDKLYSLHNQKQTDKIYLKFDDLYNYWNDARTHEDKQIILSKSENLIQSSIKLLNILKIKLKENLFDSRDNSYQRLEKINNFIEYYDIYIETILCFIHSKASLETKSFQQDKILTNYVEYIEKIINELYFNEVSNSNANTIYDYNFFQYLLLKKSDELENFLKLHGKEYSINSFKIYLFDKLKEEFFNYENSIPFDNSIPDLGVVEDSNNKFVLNLLFKSYDENQIKIAILLRDTLFKIKSIKQLLEKLKQGNIKWSSDDNDINQLELFLNRGQNELQ